MPITAELDARDQQLVDELLKSGRYASADHIVADAIALLREHETRRAAFEAAIERGLADIAAGRVHDLDEACGRLIAKYEAMAEAAE